jgi:hypothetical protein
VLKVGVFLENSEDNFGEFEPDKFEELCDEIVKRNSNKCDKFVNQNLTKRDKIANQISIRKRDKS